MSPQESQDEFDDLDEVDLEDPQLIAAMEGKVIEPDPKERLDKVAAHVRFCTILLHGDSSYQCFIDHSANRFTDYSSVGH